MLNPTEHRSNPPLSIVLLALGAIACGLLYVLWREVRKIPAKLFTLMATAFVDMLGLLMIIPLLPFYVKSLGGSGVDLLGMHFGIGIIIGFIVSAFTVAQLLSAPMWGRFSESRWAATYAAHRVRSGRDCISDFWFCSLVALVVSLAALYRGQVAAPSV